jgi:hypothetical protein
MNQDREYWLFKFGKGRGQHFVILYPDNNEIFVDVKCFPQTCFLCACCDGIGLLQVKCTNNITRTFLPMEWLIKDWGGGDDYVEALGKLKARMIGEAEKINREKQKELQKV